MGLQSTELTKRPSRRVQYTDLVATRNDMTTANYSYEANEEKLVYCAIVAVRKNELNQNIRFDPDELITISAANFGELISEKNLDKDIVTDSELYEIHRYGEKALQRVYDSYKPKVMLIKKKDDPTPIKVPMIIYCHYSKETKCMQIRFAKEFYNYFYNLINPTGMTHSFSTHQIRYVMRMRSNYAMRIYRILNSELWKVESLGTQQIHDISLERLRFALDIEDKYKLIDNLKSRVLNVAKTQINKLSNLEIDYETLKNGKFVIGIRFIYKMKDEHRNHIFQRIIDRLKEKHLKNAIPYSDDGSHFKDKERFKYIKPITKLSPKQITVLVNCDVFLNDYGYFLGNLDESIAKKTMRSLLVNKLDKLNDYKLIDLDYYFWIQAKRNMNIFKKDISEENIEDDVDENIEASDVDEILDPAEDQSPFL
nr:replication initiation protein [Acinetobacter pollinis]